MLLKILYYGIEDPNFGRLSTLIHEYTHNLGLDPSNTICTDDLCEFYKFVTVDDYLYRGIVVSDANKPEPWL